MKCRIAARRDSTVGMDDSLAAPETSIAGMKASTAAMEACSGAMEDSMTTLEGSCGPLAGSCASTETSCSGMQLFPESPETAIAASASCSASMMHGGRAMACSIARIVHVPTAMQASSPGQVLPESECDKYVGKAITIYIYLPRKEAALWSVGDHFTISPKNNVSRYPAGVNSPIGWDIVFNPD